MNLSTTLCSLVSAAGSSSRPFLPTGRRLLLHTALTHRTDTPIILEHLFCCQAPKSNVYPSHALCLPPPPIREAKGGPS